MPHAPNDDARKRSFDNVPLKSSDRRLLRARVLLPVDGAGIDNGAVEIEGNRIVSVGRWQYFSSAKRAHAIDLGDVVLFPGLVNAHCHLDYTAMARELTPPRSFVDWLKEITTSKSGWIYSDFAASWLEGAKMLVKNGVTTVADVEMAPELLPDIWTATPMRVISFLELTGVKSRRPPPEIIAEALDKIAALPPGRCRTGLSPHAPYSTTPQLLRLAGEAARRHRLPVVTHVAESSQEFEMFTRGSGKMYEWLWRNGRDMSDCGNGSPLRHLERQGLLGKNLLAVHVNYLAPGDVELLAKRRVNVVHCPRSHAYFKHRPFPLAQLAAAGVNICLGTDSLASVSAARKQRLELNMFDEMRALAASNPDLKPETILCMATRNGAAALGMRGKIGQLSRGAFADLAAIPFAGKIADACEGLVFHRGPIAASMIDAEWAIAPQPPA
jgi:cytosine/adenosine deaminase-related metal-dependent hydrolase